MMYPVTLFVVTFTCVISWGTFALRADEPTMEDVLREIPAEYGNLVKPVISLLEKFREEEDHTKEAFRQKLLEVKQAARSLNDPATAKEIIAQVDGFGEWIDKGGPFPNCDKIYQVIIQYGTAIEVSRNKLVRPLAKLTLKLKKDMATVHLESVNSAFQKLGDVLDTSAVAKPKAVFMGYRIPAGSKDQVPLLFAIEEVLGNSIKGKVEINWSVVRHPVHTMSAEYSGNAIALQTLASRDFAKKTDSSLHYSGKLYGRVLTGTYSGRDQKGKQLAGSFLVILR
jgi:hypothetical protein